MGHGPFSAKNFLLGEKGVSLLDMVCRKSVPPAKMLVSPFGNFSGTERGVCGSRFSLLEISGSSFDSKDEN